MDDLQAWINNSESRSDLQCVIRKKPNNSVEIIDMQTGTVIRKLVGTDSITATMPIFQFFRNLLDTNTLGPVDQVQLFLWQTFLKNHYSPDTAHDMIVRFAVRPSRLDEIDRIEIEATMKFEHSIANHLFFFSHNRTDDTAFISDVKFCQ
jgi:hypothetical protein